MPPSTISSMSASPIAWYSIVATAISEVPATNSRDGGGGISSCRKTRNGGVLRNWISEGIAKPTSSISALPQASSTGVKPTGGRSPWMMSASMFVTRCSTTKPTTLPTMTPRIPSSTSCTDAADMTNRCVAPRLFIKATVSMRRCAKRRADMAIATALRSKLMTAVSDRNLCARSAALLARSLPSSRLRLRTESGRVGSTVSQNSSTASCSPATSKA